MISICKMKFKKKTFYFLQYYHILFFFHKISHVQRESAEALGRQNLSFYEESIKALIHCLQPDISWEVRKIAAESLGKQNVKSMYDCILNTFITSLTKDKNE